MTPVERIQALQPTGREDDWFVGQGELEARIFLALALEDAERGDMEGAARWVAEAVVAYEYNVVVRPERREALIDLMLLLAET